MANWDGNGNIDRDYFPEDDRDAGVEILASKFEDWMASITNVVENCYTLDSQTLPISSLNMNSKKIANLSNGTATLDAVNYSQLSAVETKVDDNTAAIAGLSNRGYINGGVASNNATTPDDIIDITSLKARSSDDTQDLEVDAASLDITQTASWADSTVPTLTDLTVHIWADYNTGTQRFILDDATGSNIAGAKRRVGSFITDASDKVIQFVVIGEGSIQDYRYKAGIEDLDVTVLNTVAYDDATLSVPDDILVMANIGVAAKDAADNGVSFKEQYTGVEIVEYLYLADTGRSNTVNKVDFYTDNATIGYGNLTGVGDGALSGHLRILTMGYKIDR